MPEPTFADRYAALLTHLPLTIGGVLLAAAIAAVVAWRLPKLLYSFDTPLESGYPRWWIWASAITAVPAAAALAFLSVSPGALVAQAAVAGIGSVFFYTDIAARRAPNKPMAILYLIGLGGVLADGLIAAPLLGRGFNWAGLGSAGICLVAAVIFFLLLNVLGMGGGDLKCLPIIATVIGYSLPSVALWWVLAGFLVAFVWAMGQLVGGASIRGGKMPMLPSFVIALLVVPAIVAANLSNIIGDIASYYGSMI